MTQEINQQSEIDTLHQFLKTKEKKESVHAFEAQKLVNIFRTLSTFRESFVPQYNKMLLEASQEVQMLLPSIVGGPIVRQYLEHLQHQRHLQSGNGEEMPSATQQGYLPDPKDEAPVFFTPAPDKKLPPFPMLKKSNG